MLHSKSVLITGSNRGIGLELVKQFLGLPTAPQHVFAACRCPEKATDLQSLASKNSNLTVLKLDVTEEKTIHEARNAVASKVGDRGLTLLINNAGIANRPTDDSLSTVTVESMMNIFNVNAVGALMVSKAFLPLLQASAKSGTTMSINNAAIVNISSGTGSITDNDRGGGYAYRSSKAALNMVTKNLSIDMRSSCVLVVAIHPGWVQTDMGGQHAAEPVSASVGRMMVTMATLEGEDKNGQFYHSKGHVIPW